MVVTNKKLHRNGNLRLKSWNYSGSGVYFITICTNKRLPWFGEIHRGKMCVSQIGAHVYNNWRRIEFQFNNVQLDEFIVMPDHIHGIIIIRNNGVKRVGDNHKSININTHTYNERRLAIDADGNEPVNINTYVNNERRLAINREPTETHAMSSKPNGGFSEKRNPMIRHNSLSAVIRWFKGRVTHDIRMHTNATQFAWQPNYYEAIVRDQTALNKIRTYIRNNPKK